MKTAKQKNETKMKKAGDAKITPSRGDTKRTRTEDQREFQTRFQFTNRKQKLPEKKENFW